MVSGVCSSLNRSILTYKRMRVYSSVWQWRLVLVAMKLTQQASKYTRMKEETDVGSGACGQENLDNDKLCRKLRCWRRVDTCASTTIRTKHEPKTVTDPVKPLQIRFLETRAPRSVYVYHSTPPFRLLSCTLTVPLILVQRLERMPTAVAIPRAQQTLVYYNTLTRCKELIMKPNFKC